MSKDTYTSMIQTFSSLYFKAVVLDQAEVFGSHVVIAMSDHLRKNKYCDILTRHISLGLKQLGLHLHRQSQRVGSLPPPHLLIFE